MRRIAGFEISSPQTQCLTDNHTGDADSLGVEIPTLRMGEAEVPGGIGRDESSDADAVSSSVSVRATHVFGERWPSYLFDRGTIPPQEMAGKTLVLYRYLLRVNPTELRDFLQETSSIAQSFLAFSEGRPC